MKTDFSFEELEVLRTVRRFARNELLAVAKKVDAEGELPGDLKEKFLSLGLLRACFPEAYGGSGASFTAFVLSLKELSYASMVPAWMLFENFMLAWPILHYGSEFLKSNYLPGLISMERIGALAFTEPDTGSDPAQLKTTAKRDKDGWIVNGAKRFITNSGICDYMILFAKTEEGIGAFLVDAKKQGYESGKRETFIHAFAFDNGDVYLDNYHAPNDHLIGEEGRGFEIMLAVEGIGKIAFCSLYAGLAQRALDLSVKYANTRTHRGKAIGKKFQMIQLKLAEMKARLEAMNAYLLHICEKVDRGEEVLADAATLKILVSQDVKDIASHAMEIYGAYGLSNEYEVGNIYRNAISAQAVMGSLDIQRVIVSRYLLEKER